MTHKHVEHHDATYIYEKNYFCVFRINIIFVLFIIS